MAFGKGKLPAVVHEADLCVVGGGVPGLIAALAAARHGARTVLMHDRPVLGGNASSELRVHICGAERHGGIPNMRETGILEEIRLENLRRNLHGNYSIWDMILYEKAHFAPNLTLLLNCPCMDAETKGGRITSVTGWQLTTQTWHTVKAAIYADCSGDGILAPLTGAEFRKGREGRDEYGEPIAPEQADERTMGMSCMFEAREYDSPQVFEPPSWAYTFDSCDQLPYGAGGHTRRWRWGYWWIELGGMDHSIYDAEAMRDELLRIVLGVWDHIKNRCPHTRDETENWALNWLQFLPAKRESRRYIGDHVLNQKDVESEGRFDDLVAYGGWTMDDHHPTGFWSAKHGEPATIFHEAPSPYGIPYRSLYSRNVENLMFAGRCASCSHAAMSSTRVIGTGSSMAQAMGTAAAMAARLDVPPRGICEHVGELQQTLLRDDCYLPWVPQQIPELSAQARLEASQGDPEPVRDGVGRPLGEDAHAWTCGAGDHVAYLLAKPAKVEEVALSLDSSLDQFICVQCVGRMDKTVEVPPTLPKDFRIEGLRDGNWAPLARVEGNYQRHVRVPVGEAVEGVRFVLESTWGGKESKLFTFEVK